MARMPTIELSPASAGLFFGCYPPSGRGGAWTCPQSAGYAVLGPASFPGAVSEFPSHLLPCECWDTGSSLTLVFRPPLITSRNSRAQGKLSRLRPAKG